jgi:hypothetical protein
VPAAARRRSLRNKWLAGDRRQPELGRRRRVVLCVASQDAVARHDITPSCHQTQFIPLHLRIAAQDLVRRRGHVYSRLRSAARRRPERARGSRRRQQRSSKRDKRPHSQMAARACDAATKSRCECLCGQLEAWDADQVHKMPFISSGAGVAAARLSCRPELTCASTHSWFRVQPWPLGTAGAAHGHV